MGWEGKMECCRMLEDGLVMRVDMVFRKGRYGITAGSGREGHKIHGTG